jgi:tetratricopeptide (TPR) repeat protein
MTKMTERRSPGPKKLREPSTPRGDAAGTTTTGGWQLTEGRLLFLVVAAAVLVYANSLGGRFLVDDAEQIVGNLQLRSWSNVLRAFTSDVWGFEAVTPDANARLPYYRPLFTAYLTFAYQLFGLWEPGWHLLNLLVHCGATALVFRLARRLGAGARVAAVAALLFGLHPAHVESVSWVSGIPDPLAALFYVPAIIFYLRFRREGGRRWLWLSLAAFALSVLCKETAVVLPAFVLAWESARGGEAFAQRARRAALSAAPFVAVAALYLSARFAVLGRLGWQHPTMADASPSSILLTIPYVLASYFLHLVAPFNLSYYYGTKVLRDAAGWRFILPVLLLGGLALALWVYRRRLAPGHLAALVLTVAPLLPVLHLKVFHQEYLIQDRYLYLPSIGFCYLAALAVARAARSKPSLAYGVAAVVLVAFGVSAVLQNRIWDNGVALWSRAAAHAPGSWAPHYNLGLAHMGEKNYPAARAAFVEAARLNPGAARIHNNLAMAQDGAGDAEGAVAGLRHALALDANLVEARNNLGAVHFRRGEYAAAREQLGLALKQSPSSGAVRFNLARVLAAQQEHASAIRLYEAALADAPGDAEVRFHLGLSYAAAGRRGEALSQIERALSGVRAGARAEEMRAALASLRRAAQ